MCQILDGTESQTTLSGLTVWTQEALQEILSQRQHIFLAYLRVYKLLQPIKVLVHPKLHLLAITEDLPVLSDRIFVQRKQQLGNLQPPLYPELKELQSAIARLAIINPAAENLNHHIQTFLGWASD